MTEFTSKCDICGNNYDSYMRTFYIQYSMDRRDRKCVCLECLGKESVKKPYKFVNHIPTFCDGGDLIVRLFDTKEELIEWIKNKYYKEYEEICCDGNGLIITVNKSTKCWWVVGNSNLKNYDFPDWKETVIKYHGSL